MACAAKASRVSVLRLWDQLHAAVPVNMPDLIFIHSRLAQMHWPEVSGPNDCCTPTCFWTGTAGPKPNTVSQNQIGSRLGLHNTIWDISMWKNGTKSESGKLVVGWLLPARNQAWWFWHTGLLVWTRCVLPNLDQAIQIRSRSVLHNMIHDFFGSVCWCQCVVTQPKPWCWCQCVMTQLKLWCWCQCVMTQPKPWCWCQSVLWHSPSHGVVVSVLWHSPSLGVGVSVLWHSPSLGVRVSVLWHSPSLGVAVSVLWQPKPWCWCQCVMTQPKPWCCCQCVVTVSYTHLTLPTMAVV